MHEPIRVRNLWKVFGGPVQTVLDPDRLAADPTARIAVRDVSLEVRAGEILVVMGLSGSGKSTLLRMLNGLITPSAGEVEVDGRLLQDVSRKDLICLRRSNMAMVFQSFALFPQRTALDNAAFGLEVAGLPRRQRIQKASDALERVGLGNDLHRRPSQLSGGMRQRVGLARALALDPPVLLMDEAFSALDPLIRRDMQDLLLDLQREHRRTIVFVSHDLDEAVRIGDRIALMQEGSLLQCGPAEELLLHPREAAVTSFFRGLDKTTVLRVESIAEPPPDDLVIPSQECDQHLLQSSTLLREAVSTVAAAGGPVPVVNDHQQIIGVVTAEGLLHAIGNQ